MAIEIERKFLVRNDGWRAQVQKSIPMRHGYLAPLGGKASVRVRVEGEVGKLNVKAAKVGMSRAEYEYEIPAAEAEEMLASLCSGLILKTRHYLRLGPHVWEIDVFEGDNAPLIVAEIELGAEDETFDKPEWLGREITEDRRYYNHALSVTPYKTWD
ncbi:MAG: CYTH domain-containing protein [Stagnimonas sp.]|nr:CYTH domain-containing protein [Stagnimonas sp.]